MPKTVFFFGRNPVLSLAELVSVLSIHEPDSRVHALWNNAALVEGVEKNPVSLLERLGGTTKIAQATTEWSGSLSEKGGVFFGEKFFDSFGEKFFFALSRLGKISEKDHDELLGALKAGFKKNRQKALLKRGTKRKQRNRFVTNPSEIEAWRLLENKTDFCIAKTPDGFLFCQTIAVSRPEQWKWRDENRPVKDNKEIVSIRLAKILVNLAGLKEGQTVLDPFCGYGTILQEALLHGLNGIGIEKDAPKAQACRRNLEWAQKEFRVHGKITIHNADAVQLERVLEKNAFDAVVTEPYLGPYLNKKPSHEKAQRIMNELRSLYQQFFSVLVNCMNSGQRVVFIFPLFEFPGGERLRLPETVFSTWFVNVNPLQGMGSEWKNAFPFPYQNPNNKLAREIRVLQRK